jgi:hypothetical protein
MSTVHTSQHPMTGDVLVCEKCGMKMEVTADCKCKDGAHLECCGQPLSAVPPTPPPPERAKRS